MRKRIGVKREGKGERRKRRWMRREVEESLRRRKRWKGKEEGRT